MKPLCIVRRALSLWQCHEIATLSDMRSAPCTSKTPGFEYLFEEGLRRALLRKWAARAAGTFSICALLCVSGWLMYAETSFNGDVSIVPLTSRFCHGEPFDPNDLGSW